MSHSLKLTNTLTRSKEEFKPLHPPKVTLYVCGVTVYDQAHIGHARGAVVFDVLRRHLESKGFEVTHVRNITDVDDKIIERSRTLGISPQALAQKYEASFQEDFKRLGLLSPTYEPRATEYIPKMIRFIENLIEHKIAYPAADGVYFSVRQLPEYGQLSHQKLDQMLENAHVDAGAGKKDPLDFALWKKAKADEPNWDSPWGAGRPGWHIECSTMSTDSLGEAFDIHGGGQDLIFPHHENERAQAIGAGKKFARYWLHNGLLTVNGQKMSKSLGNFVTISEVLKRHSNPDVLRLFFLSAHYRSPQDFTWERLDEASHAYERWAGFIAHEQIKGSASEGNLPTQIEAEFSQALEDDLNTPRALACLHGLVGYPGAARKLQELGKVLGFFQSAQMPDPAAEKLAKARDAARARKDFSTSDRIRKQLTEMGYVVEDTTGGTVVRKRA